MTYLKGPGNALTDIVGLHSRSERTRAHVRGSRPLLLEELLYLPRAAFLLAAAWSSLAPYSSVCL